MQVMASDADDPTYGSSARVVYSVLEGEQHFTVDSKTGEQHPAGLGHSVRGVRRPDHGHASRLCSAHGCVSRPVPPCWPLMLGYPCHGHSCVLERKLDSCCPAPCSACSRQHCGARLAAASLSVLPVPAVATAPLCALCPGQECTCRRIKHQCERFKYYQRGLTKGCIVITRALIKGNTLN